MKLFKYLILAIFLIVFNQSSFAEDIKSKLDGKIYSKLNEFTQNIGEGLAKNLENYENLKYLDYSINLQDNLKPTIEIQSVSELINYNDGTLFNQINLLSHDQETTINFGIGKRKLVEDETLMLGTNIFLDYQFDESHLRTGIGFEAISNSLDFIANYYNAVSGFKSTEEGREKALDGYDLRLNYHLSKKNNTDLFLELFEWENPNSTFEEDGEKFGISSLIGNVAIVLGYLNDNRNNDGIFGSVKVVVPIGKQKSKNNISQTTNINNLSVRNKLYVPVQRDNKIKVVKISKSGVKISGF